MFWCMLASDDTAMYCDILQNRNGAQVFYDVCFMRIRAVTCDLLQHLEIWTQNKTRRVHSHGGSIPPPGIII